MENSANLTQQLAAFKAGRYLDSSGNDDTRCYNFYDWFCKDSSLQRKSDNLFRAVQTFVKKFNIDTDKNYVFFKNNCPMLGPLYDSFSICDVETGDVQFWVTPKSGHTRRAEICSRTNNFNQPLYSGESLSEIYRKML